MEKSTTTNCIYTFTADKFPMNVIITDRVTGKTGTVFVKNQFDMDFIYLMEKLMFSGALKK